MLEMHGGYIDGLAGGGGRGGVALGRVRDGSEARLGKSE